MQESLETQIKKSIEEHNSKIEKLRSELQRLNTALEVIEKFKGIKSITNVERTDMPKYVSMGKTFIDFVIDIITAENRLLKGKEIYNLGGFSQPYKTFSSQLTQRAKAGKITQWVVSGASNDSKYFYGLNEFFNDNNQPKREYYLGD